MKTSRFWPILLLLVLAASRWPGVMPHNFSATYAIVFCAGLYLTGWAAWVLPLGILAASDFALSRFYYDSADFSLRQFALDLAPNYAGYICLIALGRAFNPRRPAWLLTAGGILGAVIFYLVTNTGSWLELPYAKSMAGWWQALTVGLPGYPPTWLFFRNTLLSGGIFTGLFVGSMKLTAANPLTEEEKDSPPETETPAEPADAAS